MLRKLVFLFAIFGLLNGVPQAARSYLKLAKQVTTATLWQVVPEENRIIFCDPLTGQTSVYSLPDFGLIETFFLGNEIAGQGVRVWGLYYSAIGKRLYVLAPHIQGNALITYDPAENATYNGQPSKKRLAAIYRDIRPPLTVDFKHNVAFADVPNGTPVSFSAINLATGDFIKTLGRVDYEKYGLSNWGVLYEAGSRLVVPNEDESAVGVDLVDTGTLEVIKTLKFASPDDPSRMAHETWLQNAFDGKNLVIRTQRNFFVLDLDGNILAQDSDLRLWTAYDPASMQAAVYTQPADAETRGSFRIHDLESRQVSYGIPAMDAGVVETPDSYGIFFFQGRLFHIRKGSVAELGLPLVGPLDDEFVFPFIRQNASEWTGMAMKNSGAYAAAHARNRSGGMVTDIFSLQNRTNVVNPSLLDFSAEPQLARFPQEIWGSDLADYTHYDEAVRSASVYGAAGEEVKGFYLYGDSGLTKLDGSTVIPVQKEARPNRYFIPIDSDPESQNNNYHTHLQTFHVSPSQEMTVDFIRYDNAGQVLFEFIGRDLPPKYGSGGSDILDTFRGYHEYRSEAQLVSTAVIGKPGQDVSIFAVQSLDDARGELIFAQHTSIDGSLTDIVVIEPFGEGQMVQVELVADSGAFLGSVIVAISSHAMLWQDTVSLLGASEQTGYLRVRSLDGQGLIGWVRFKIGPAEAALPAQEARQVVEIQHVAQVPPKGNTIGWNHGVTVLNPNPFEIQVLVEAFLPDETRTANTTLSLAPGQKLARHLFEIFGAGFEQTSGFLRLTSLTPEGEIIAFSLFYSTPEFKVISAIPGQ